MTILLAVAGGALCVAGDISQSAAVYLWIPGVLLLTLAFRRAITRPVDPRPGYIIDPKDQP